MHNKDTTTTTAIVYWPSPSTGYNLQLAANPAATNWGSPPESGTGTGTIKLYHRESTHGQPLLPFDETLNTKPKR